MFCPSFRAPSGSADESQPRAGRGARSDSYLGDIAICPAVARRNARGLGRTLDNEMRILILHGILHLMGYDHETDTGQMERRERRLRRALGVGLAYGNGCPLKIVGGLILTAVLVVLSYVDRVYRDLGRVATSRVHQHLGVF